MSVFGRRVRVTFWHLFLFVATAAFAADFIVTNTNDSGPGSLRDAIDNANASNASPHRILFAIPGAGVQRINVTSSLPPIDRPLDIDGTTQGDTTAGPLVEVVGQFPGNTTFTGFFSSSNLIVRRLSIGRFNIGVDFAGTGQITGSYLGVAADGTTPIPNDYGIQAETPSDISGNRIAQNGTYGVLVAANGVRILNNSFFTNGLAGIAFAVPSSNNGQAAPVLTSAFAGPSSTRIVGTLTSAPSETFTVQFFSNPVAEQQGRTFLGQVAVSTDATGAGSFDTTLPAVVAAGSFVNSTATRLTTSDTSPSSADLLPVTPGEINFSAATFSTAEGAGTFNLALTRTGGSTGAVTVNVNITGGTATSPADYTAVASASFANGVTTANAVVTLNQDLIDEIDETATFSISAPTGGATIGAQSTTTLTIVDDDTAGINLITPPAIVTTEAGGTGTFSVVLTSQPLADVTIGLTSSDLTEGTVAPPSLTFTAGNWNVPQPVTITGVDDALADGPQPYTIITAPAVSADPLYSGRNAADASVTNTDNDTSGITVTPATITTTEAGGTSTLR